MGWRKIKKRKLARGVQAKGVLKKKSVKQGLDVLPNSFCAGATNLPKKMTLTMILVSDFSQQILTFLEDTHFHDTRPNLPEQLLTRAT
jgi:hypothetical protein